MKLALLLMVAFFFLQCNKAESYCELPPKIIKASEFGANGEDIHHIPSDEILIYVSVENKEGTTNEEMHYSFSTPHYFINPKGNYPTDVVVESEYLYRLNDTLVYQDTIEVEMYTFNDCGRTEVFKKWIIFD